VTRKITRGLARIKAGLDDCLYLGNLDALRDWGHARDYVRAQWLMLQQKLYLGNLDARRDWGHARDYVEGMWRIVQQAEPDDYVLATGEAHSVREFVEKAFAVAGKTIEWSGKGADEIGVDPASGETVVEIDPQYFRPTEVDVLVGDAAKARLKLGWKHTTSFDDLVREMVEADRRIVRDEHQRRNRRD
jgi:GDPmannose 4,6-dehydratase